MTTRDHPSRDDDDRSRPRSNRSRRMMAVVLSITTSAVVVGAWLIVPRSATAQEPRGTAVPAHDHSSGSLDDAQRTAAMLATAGFQDVDTAEAAGYASSIDTLGCFQNPSHGGMGLHYIDSDLLDDQLDIAHPEALVYELDSAGKIVGLVAHEYIVPVDAWTATKSPRLFGQALHRHPTLPLWVLHTWLWKDNPDGVFADWNPAVRLCPAGLPIFGRDLPS